MEIEINSFIQLLRAKLVKFLFIYRALCFINKLLDEPVVFEINPRFSSTVRFRDLFGFADVKWSIEDKMNYLLSDYTDISVGKKLYKAFNEYIE